MFQSRFALHAVAFIGLILGSRLAAADPGTAMAGVIDLAVANFTYVDTSGEPVDQTAAHRERLSGLVTALKADLTAEGRYHLVPLSCRPPCRDDGSAPGDLVDAAADAGAGILVMGGIHKTSTLVQWAKVEVVDIAAKRVVFDRLYTFRGDNEAAWQRAEAFISRDVRDALAKHQPPAPIDLAIFDFELEDASAASTADSASDRLQLAGVTSAVRELLAQSGRYRLIDVGSADAAAVKAHALRDCNGCDAGIARQLGAGQSFVGVIRRVSRTEYTVRFQIRDAASSAVVAAQNSGLRMGADYSWSRGATRLIKDGLLENAAQQ